MKTLLIAASAAAMVLGGGAAMAAPAKSAALPGQPIPYSEYQKAQAAKAKPARGKTAARPAARKVAAPRLRAPPKTNTAMLLKDDIAALSAKAVSRSKASADNSGGAIGVGAGGSSPYDRSGTVNPTEAPATSVPPGSTPTVR